MKQLCFGVLFYLLAESCAIAQALQVRVQYGADPLVLGNTYYSTALGDSLVFNTCKFYISGINMGKSNTQIHLIDLEDPSSLSIPLSTAMFTQDSTLRFVLGVDSTTTVSGAYEGPLDPTNGMYWTWQTGYIHLKLEGVSPACQSRNHLFQLHLGGYAAPHNALQIIELAWIETESPPVLSLDLEPFVDAMQLHTQPEIMRPGSQATAAAQKLAACFKIAQK